MMKKIFSLSFSFSVFLILQNLSFAVDVSSFPDKVKVVGEDKEVPFESLCIERPILLLVGSHSSLILANQLPKSWLKKHMLIKAKQFISVAAVGEAPLFVKELLLNGYLEELRAVRDKELKSLMPDITDSSIIIDFDGKVVDSLSISGIGKSGFEAFVILKDGKIEKIYSGQIKSKKNSYKQALQEMMVEKEADAILDAAKKYFTEQ